MCLSGNHGREFNFELSQRVGMALVANSRGVQAAKVCKVTASPLEKAGVPPVGRECVFVVHGF
jgi:hypothetical protein